MEVIQILYEKSEEVSNYIRKCNSLIHHKGHEIACEYGLTYDQYHILLYLKKLEESPSIRQVSEKFNIAQNTTSEKLTRLEEKDLIRRERDLKDRRITRIIIEDKALDLLEQIRKERTERLTYKALERMEDEEIEVLLESLKNLYNIFEEEYY